MKFAQIAKLLKTSTKQVKMEHDRALRKLARELRPLALAMGWIKR